MIWHRKFGDRFEPDFKKAVASGVITVLDYSRPELYLSSLMTPPQATAAVRVIVDTGRDYALRVGKGEAYSHAACVSLGMPLLSHDKSAIDTLGAGRLKTAAPVLRVFDLIGLAYHHNKLPDKQCDLIRQILGKADEFVPAAFKNTSFVKGFSHYNQRLFEAAGPDRPACVKFDDPLFLPLAKPNPPR